MTRLACFALASALAIPGASGADEIAPAMSNGRIVFVASTGNGIASMNPDGSGVWSVMLGVGDGEPAWSVDGSRLAVAVRWPGGEGITVMDPAGSARIRLTSNASDSHPTWAPDGRTLAFSAGGDIAVVPAGGGAVVRLTTGPEHDTEPAWSPDGRSIAFTRRVDGVSSIWMIDVETRSEKLVVPEERDAGGPSWSPHGDLTYVAGTAAFLRSAAGADRLLVAPVDHGSSIVWAPDASRILYVFGSAIFVARHDGALPTRLVSGRSPSWQPLAAGPSDCTFWGTEGADILVGTPGDDVICGLGGNDTVLGLDGDDLLRGGPGSDWIAGGQGNDGHFGGEGDDRIDSRDGLSDFVSGGAGRDTGLLEARDARLSIERPRVDGNLAAWRPVTASGLGVPDPPERAVDGRADDLWNSGGWPPAWIEVDLQRPTDIGRLRLVAGPQSADTTHLVLGKGPATRGAFRLLAKVRGPTVAAQEIMLRPRHPWRAVRRLRIATAGRSYAAEWVSWHEIEVYAPRRKR